MTSLAEAGNLNVFPDYKKALMKLNVEVPSLETLFGNSDFCECYECRSVYGAAAYLADILHFLEFRNSDTPGISIKDLLVYRRPDIADIDLTCDNTNTLVPYIDIACELMEEYIRASKVTLNISFAASFAKGVIDPSLFTEITNQFTAAGFGDISNLLTKDAKVSDPYNANRYDGVNLVTEKYWIIRDKLVELKATETATGVDVLLLHQTLLSADEVSANPEYVNVPVYDLLKKQQRPFTLPFDLFETEGELYLEKLGINKSDLIKAFKKEHDVSGPPTDGDLNVAYSYLNVNETERQLIFVEDLLNQTNYWGTIAAGTSVGVNDFE